MVQNIRRKEGVRSRRGRTKYDRITIYYLKRYNEAATEKEKQSEKNTEVSKFSQHAP